MKQALATALETRGYDKLTPVQEAVTADDLTGKDLLVSAQTGSGKTLGFGLAIAPTLLGDDERFDRAGAPLALVIAPTRELALQVKRELTWLYAEAGAHLASTVGGMDMRDERRSLARGAHIVVATPGRLRDHIMRGSIDLSEIRAVVLDEADEMLDLGFREDLEFILGEAPVERQTLLFSATVPRMIATLAKNYQRDAVRVSTTAEKSQHADIEYVGMGVGARDAENAIINVLRYYEAPNAIVFCNTRAMVNRLTTRLSNRGFSVVALSGELTQTERTHALQAMRDGRARVCVATDVAARGIDLPNLDLVVHAELPSNHETLLHRSGRTGRAGRKGVSAIIAPPQARRKAERLLHFAKLKAEWGPAPSADAVMARDEERMLADNAWSDPIAENERETVDKLVEAFSAEQIAAAYLRLRRENHTAPEDISDVDEKPKPRGPFGPSVWFSLTGLARHNAEPRRLLPILCKSGDLTKDDIGAIRVQGDVAYAEIKEASVAGFLDAIGPDMSVEDAELARLAEPPAGVKAPRPHGGKPRAHRPEGGKPRKASPDRHDRDDERKPPKRETRPTPRPEPSAEKQAPQPASPSRETPPVVYDDAPAPRAKKPKSPTKSGGKPAHARKSRPTDEAVKTGALKPRRAKSAADPGASLRDRPGGKPKGPKPPKGKPNSKKNRARAAAKTAGRSDGGRGPQDRRRS